MKEWFKARNIWGAAILTLDDEEAGRLMKALWHYTMTGEEDPLPGAERGIFALMIAMLEQDGDKENDVSEKRAAAGSKGGKQKVANVANAIFATNEVANVANATNKNKNKEEDIEKETLLTESKEKAKRFSPPSVEEVAAYCRERNNDIDAEQFVAFYASKGWKVGNSPMKDWKQCVITWEKRGGRNGPQRPAKTVIAQQYEQRDYSGVQDEYSAEQDREMEEYMRREGLM